MSSIPLQFLGLTAVEINQSQCAAKLTVTSDPLFLVILPSKFAYDNLKDINQQIFQFTEVTQGTRTGMSGRHSCVCFH
jgi:hypothetical protein